MRAPSQLPVVRPESRCTHPPLTCISTRAHATLLPRWRFFSDGSAACALGLTAGAFVLALRALLRRGEVLQSMLVFDSAAFFT